MLSKLKTIPIGRKERLIKSKIALFQHKVGFLKFVKDEEETKDYMRENNISINDNMIANICVGYSKDVGFIRQFTIHPKVLKL